MFDAESRKNCISYWGPLLASSGVLHPETILIETGNLMELMDGKIPEGFDDFRDRLIAAVEYMGTPAFLRCGYTSGKHDWRRTCFVTDKNKMINHVTAIIEHAECASLFGMPDYNVWAVRKYIPLVEAGIATRSGMPITKERRYFIEKGKILCHHPYYPIGAVLDMLTREDSLRLYGEDWDFMESREPIACELKEIENALERVNREDQAEIDLLSEMSMKVAEKFDGQWSLDWAMGQDGHWYAIDMARAKESYHWEGCTTEFT